MGPHVFHVEQGMAFWPGFFFLWFLFIVIVPTLCMYTMKDLQLNGVFYNNLHVNLFN